MIGGPRRHWLLAPIFAFACLVGLGAGPAAAARHGVPPGPPAAASPSTPATARPAVGAGALSVAIRTVSPSIPTLGDHLTLRGTVTNVSSASVREVTAQLRVSPTPLPSRGEIPEVLAGAGQREGEVVPDATEHLADVLDPGASAEFVVSVAMDELRLPDPGAYVTGVEALGDNGQGAVRQDLDRTFLPWWPTGTDAQPLLLTTLWPLSALPVRDAEGVLLDEAPAIEMSPAGRLDTLLRAGAAAPGAVSLVLDPDTVAAAAQLADGYEVRAGESTVPGTRSDEVARWLDLARDAVTSSGADATAMLAAQPDLVAASRGRVLAALLAQRPLVDDQTADALGTKLPARLALLPGGVSDQRTLTRLVAGRVPAAVLSDRALPLTTPTYFTPSGTADVATPRGSLRVLIADSDLSDTLAMSMSGQAEQTAVRQRLLAETLVTVLELPQTQRLVVMSPDPGWSPSESAARMVVTVASDTPWLTPVPLSTALAREPSSVARTLSDYGAEQAAAELPASRAATVREQLEGLGSYAAVLTEPATLAPVTRTAPTRVMSAWFRSHDDLGAELTGAVSAQVRTAVRSVRVVSSGSVTVSGASGTVPVTVENNGSLPVTVGMEMTSTPPQRFVASPVAPFAIEPGRRTSVEVTAQVVAAGPIRVRIQLTDAAGRAFGVPGSITVQSSAYANAARILVRIALAALAIAVVVHGIRRARRMRAARGAAGSERRRG